MSISRCATIAGPGKIVTATGTYVTTGDITVRINRSIRDLMSSLAGRVGGLLRGTDIEISAELVPVPIYATQLITLQPTNIGDPIFGCTDAYIEVHGRDGIKFRFSAGALIGPPTVNFSSTKNLYGTARWGCVVANAADIATANTVLTRSSSAFTNPEHAHSAAGWVNKGGKIYFDDTDQTETNPYWGFGSEDGVEVAVEYGTNAQEDDLNGKYGLRLGDVKCAIKFKPVGLTDLQVLALMPVDGASAVPGVNVVDLAKSIKVQHNNLAVGDLIFEAALAYADSNNLAWGATINRHGEITMTCIASYSGGAALPLYSFALEEAP